MREAASAGKDADSHLWYYSVDGGEAKGPLPRGALLKLVARGVIVAERTALWRSGIETWLALPEALGEAAALARSTFYYASGSGERVGPVNTVELSRRFERGEIDGLTRIWHNDTWLPISDVSALKDLLARPEQLEEYDHVAQTFEPDQKLEAVDTIKTKKRGFVADDGRAFAFDEATQDWVEVDAVEEEEDEEEEHEENERVEEKKAVEKPSNKKKKKQKKFDAKAAKCWVYIQGLPGDTTREELAAHFSKCGILATDPETALPKIKIYTTPDGMPKGDGAVCYAHAASVDLATQILDGGSLRYGHQITVSRADFSKQRLGEYDASKSRRVNSLKVKNAKKATKQLARWDADEDADDSRPTDSLRILVVQYAFEHRDLQQGTTPEDLKLLLLKRIEQDLLEPPEKITIFSNRRDGVMVIKTKTANDAHVVINNCNGAPSFSKANPTLTMRCFFWDGVTNYNLDTPGTGADVVMDAKVASEDDENKRIHEFGDWLEQQEGELPPELQLRVER